LRCDRRARPRALLAHDDALEGHARKSSEPRHLVDGLGLDAAGPAVANDETDAPLSHGERRNHDGRRRTETEVGEPYAIETGQVGATMQDAPGLFGFAKQAGHVEGNADAHHVLSRQAAAKGIKPLGDLTLNDEEHRRVEELPAVLEEQVENVVATLGALHLFFGHVAHKWSATTLGRSRCTFVGLRRLARVRRGERFGRRAGLAASGCSGLDRDVRGRRRWHRLLGDAGRVARGRRGWG
jgi:hypothetical protein